MSRWNLSARAFFVLLVSSLFACGQAPSGDQGRATVQAHTVQVAAQPAPSLDANGQPPADYLPTPHGFRHKSCIFKLPSGATVAENGDTTIDGVTTHHDPCPYAEIANPASRSSSPTTNDGGSSATNGEDGGTPPFIGHTWVESEYQTTGGVGFNGLWATMTVPAVPQVWLAQVLYFFPALQPAGQSSLPLMQPVLAWGDNGEGCGEQGYWCLSSYYLVNGNTYQGGLAAVWPGDTISTWMQVTSQYCCGQNWQIGASDNNRSASTTLNVQSSTWFNTSSPAVMEVYNIDWCSNLPNSADTYFYNIYLSVPNPGWEQFRYVTVNMTPIQASGLNPSCNYNVITYPSNGAYLFY